jgi:methyl coenzyme M reductase subunit C-like uncharacterized protein (methanogenesis marker protein 7)
VNRFKPNPNLAAELEIAAKPALIAAANAVKPRVEAEKHSIMRRPSSRPVVVDIDVDEVRVVNTDYGAWIDEIGSVNSPPSAPLRRAVRAAGLRLTEHGN